LWEKGDTCVKCAEESGSTEFAGWVHGLKMHQLYSFALSTGEARDNISPLSTPKTYFLNPKYHSWLKAPRNP
jgi:hypothetical protein